MNAVLRTSSTHSTKACLILPENCLLFPKCQAAGDAGQIFCTPWTVEKGKLFSFFLRLCCPYLKDGVFDNNSGHLRQTTEEIWEANKDVLGLRETLIFACPKTTTSTDLDWLQVDADDRVGGNGSLPWLGVQTARVLTFIFSCCILQPSMLDRWR